MKFLNSMFVAFVLGALPQTGLAEQDPFRLSREIQLEMTNLKELALDSKSENITLHLRFSAAVDKGVYYYGYVYEIGKKFEANMEASFYVRIAEDQDNKLFKLSLISITSSYSTDAYFEINATASRFDGKGKSLKVTGMNQIEFLKEPGSNSTLSYILTEKNSHVPYWIKYKIVSSLPDPKLELKLITSLVSKDESKQALGDLTVTGSIEYFGGDGCEKGNMFMLTNEDKNGPNVNVVQLDFDKFYVPKDYDTLPKRLLRKLFIRDDFDIKIGKDTKLNGPDIPFTFVGQVNTFTQDYLEGPPWWEVIQKRGTLYLGKTANNKLEIVTVLALVSEVAAKSGLDLKTFHDVQYSYKSKNILAFQFLDMENEDASVLVDLQTGKIGIEE